MDLNIIMKFGLYVIWNKQLFTLPKFAIDKLDKNIDTYKIDEGVEKFDLIINAVASTDFESITSLIPQEKYLRL